MQKHSIGGEHMTESMEKRACELAAYGIRAIPYNTLRPSMDPSLNYRDHRKLCVIDGKVGFCGGINLADEYINAVERFGHWKDTAVQLRGSAVRSLTRMFLQQWTLLAGPQALKRPEEEYLCHIPRGHNTYL